VAERDWYDRSKRREFLKKKKKKLPSRKAKKETFGEKEGLLLHSTKNAVVIVVVYLATAKIDVVVTAMSRLAICVTHLHVTLVRNAIGL
jgi:hypothetical protein